MAVSKQDTELISRCLAGEAGAYELLYDAHARPVMAYLLRSGFSRADADDLIQETFSRAFRSLWTFDPARGSFRPWVATIARNVVRKRWSRRPAPENFDPELAEETLAGGDNPGVSAQEGEEFDAVRECVSALGEPWQRIVRLRYVEGLTTRGIAAATGIPEATVRSRLTEAQEKLRRCLQAKGVVE